MLFFGSAGVGKTCSRNIVTGEIVPSVQHSTPLATRPVSMYQFNTTDDIWKMFETEERMKFYAGIARSLYHQRQLEVHLQLPVDETTSSSHDVQIRASQTSTTDQQPQEKYHSLSRSNSKDLSGSDIDINVAQVIQEVIDKLFQLIDEYSETGDIHILHKLQIIDSGGQPQFHEVLPIFLRKVSFYAFVFKLSEELSSHPLVEYVEYGQKLGKEYRSKHSTVQLFQHLVRTVHTSRHNMDYHQGKPARILLFGTHYDEVEKCNETIEMKNQKFSEILLPDFKEHVQYYRMARRELIFPLNAKSPSDNEKAIAERIRSIVAKECQSSTMDLPLQWMALEIVLEEVAKVLDRGFLSRSECLKIAQKLHFEEDALEAALLYLDELSLIFYYPDILPDLIFTDPQVLLDKVTELVRVHFDLMQGTGSYLDCAESKAGQEFFDYAFVTVKFLSQDIFQKHYVPGLFRPEDLVTVFRKLFIFAECDDVKSFVPCILRMLDDSNISKLRKTFETISASPLVLKFSQGGPYLGIFCSLMSFLTSPKNHFPSPWKLKLKPKSTTPSCLYRNCIQFTIPKVPCVIMLIDVFSHFEVHINTKFEEVYKNHCPLIYRALFLGIQKVAFNLGYTNFKTEPAFLCPCGHDEPHVAECGDTYWTCSLDESVGGMITDNQRIWLESQDTHARSTNSLNLTPTVPDLLHFRAVGDRYINIPREVGTKYQNFGALLLLDNTTAHVDALAHELRWNAEGINLRILQEWLVGKGKEPKTWATLVKVLNDIEMGELAHLVQQAKITTTNY